MEREEERKPFSVSLSITSQSHSPEEEDQITDYKVCVVEEDHKKKIWKVSKNERKRDTVRKK